MPSDEIEHLLNEIGQMLAEDDEYPLEGTLLYAEVAPAMVEASIFKDLGNRILFRWASDQLCDSLLDLWEAEEPDKRWATMQYMIRDSGKFEILFTFPSEIDPDEDSMDRRRHIVKQRYGDRPVHYPPLPGGDDSISFEF